MIKDDSAIPRRHSSRDDPALRPMSSLNLSAPSSPGEPSSDRYRRSSRRVDTDAQSTTWPHPSTAERPPAELAERPPAELAKRYRRRSSGNLDGAGQESLPVDAMEIDGGDVSHSRKESTGSVGSSRSSISSVYILSLFLLIGFANCMKVRGREFDSKRASRSSPLSQSNYCSTDSSEEPVHVERKPDTSPSLATQRLTEIRNSEASKSGTSRLRRAFSFSSVADLRDESHHGDVAGGDDLRRQRLEEELGAEQAAIAEQQEASGLGESIYTHQGGSFLRGKDSVDGMSVSSTASSASLMLRKMGRGMKRSGKSIAGLFRPKSVISLPPAEATTVAPTEPTVSVVNVEAQRKLETHRSSGGAPFAVSTESNSTTVTAAAASLEGARSSRQNIVGGDRERAEILAAVNSRKGILKSMCILCAPSIYWFLFAHFADCP